TTATNQSLAIGAKGHAADHVRVPLKGEGFPTGGRVPDPHRLVLTAPANAPAVGANGHTTNPALLPLRGEGRPAGGRVPDHNRLVITAADEALAVGAEGHAADRANVSAKSLHAAVEKREQVIVLPAAKVPAARIQIVIGGQKTIVAFPGL